MKIKLAAVKPKVIIILIIALAAAFTACDDSGSTGSGDQYATTGNLFIRHNINNIYFIFARSLEDDKILIAAGDISGDFIKCVRSSENTVLKVWEVNEDGSFNSYSGNGIVAFELFVISKPFVTYDELIEAEHSPDYGWVFSSNEIYPSFSSGTASIIIMLGGG